MNPRAIVLAAITGLGLAAGAAHAGGSNAPAGRPVRAVAATTTTVNVMRDFAGREQKAPYAGTPGHEYSIGVLGVPSGGKVTATVRGPVRPIVWPNAAGGRSDQAQTSAAQRKRDNRTFNRALAGAVGSAAERRVLGTAIQEGATANTVVALHGYAQVPTGSTIDIDVTSRTGAKSGTRIQAMGTPLRLGHRKSERYDNVAQMVRGTETITVQGPQAAMKPQIVRTNLAITPVRRNADGRSFVKVLALAGVSPNATVTVTNLRMKEARVPGATQMFFANHTGSGDVKVPAQDGDVKFEVSVYTPATAAQPASVTREIIDAPLAKGKSDLPGGFYRVKS